MSAQANTGTVLDRILEARRAEVDRRKRVLPETALKYGVKAATPLRSFSAALGGDGLNVVAELKPASPSRGVIRDPFEPMSGWRVSVSVVPLTQKSLVSSVGLPVARRVRRPADVVV